ncbi:MAG: histidine phosphatase family protein [Chloroflexi bacterium]|nr:histidine phosphatase family protein [Chloroflexota bacterium]
MTTIDLVRHADVYNPRDVFYGRLPRFGLSDLGRRQATALAARCAGWPIVAIYTSPLLRARQTALLLARGHPSTPPVRVSRLLTEVGSHWQGRPTADLDTIGFDFFSRATEGDESIPAVFQRMERLVRRLARRHAGGHVVCVSHADPIMIARVGLADRPLVVASLRGQPDYPAKASISRLAFLAPTAEPTITYLPPPVVT